MSHLARSPRCAEYTRVSVRARARISICDDIGGTRALDVWVSRACESPLAVLYALTFSRRMHTCMRARVRACVRVRRRAYNGHTVCRNIDLVNQSDVLYAPWVMHLPRAVRKVRSAVLRNIRRHSLFTSRKSNYVLELVSFHFFLLYRITQEM